MIPYLTRPRSTGIGRLAKICIVSALTILVAIPARADKLPSLVLAGPPAIVSVPLIHMVETGALKEVADSVEFISWWDPDQLRVLAMSGKADFLAMPSNVAANLYNRGQPLKLLNISTWGVLWIVSRDKTSKTLADFRGKEIAIPFRADMPDVVFGLLAQKQGLDPKKDFSLRYVASPLDAMQLLVTPSTPPWTFGQGRTHASGWRYDSRTDPPDGARPDLAADAQAAPQRPAGITTPMAAEMHGWAGSTRFVFKTDRVGERGRAGRRTPG